MRILAMIGIGITVVAVIVGVVVGTKRHHSPSTNHSTTTINTNTAAFQAPARFTASKSFVTEVCQGFGNETKDCRDTCHDAPDCCSLISNQDNSSCLVNDLEGCFRYAACQVLDSNIPRAPDDLEQLCTAKNTTACRNACLDVQCCWNQDLVEPCPPSFLLTCIDYSPCQNLNHTLKVAPLNLDETCRNDRDACDASCASAQCCWNTTTDNCLVDDFLSCITYAPCGRLLLPEPNMVVPRPSSQNWTVTCNLNDLIEGLQTTVTECQTACEVASCCTNHTKGGNCFFQDPLGCLGYATCDLLKLTGGTVPRAPENLIDICSWENITAGQPDTCINACQPASCCVSLNLTDNCLANGNAIVCSEYAPCALLWVAGGDEVSDPPDTLDATCSRTNVATSAGRNDCETLCQTVSCCWDLSCVLGHIDTCFKWTTGGCWRVFG